MKIEIIYASLGRIYLQQQKYRDSISQYKVAIKLNPDNIFYYHTNGESFIKIKQY